MSLAFRPHLLHYRQQLEHAIRLEWLPVPSETAPALNRAPDRMTGWRVSLWFVVTLVAQAALWPASVPVALKACLIGLAVLSAWRPALGLLALAAFMPFGNVMAVRFWMAPGFQLAEALTLAFLSGYLFPRRRSGPPPRAADAVDLSALAFGAVIVTTCAVQFAIERAWQANWGPFISSFLQYLATDYLTAQPSARPELPGTGFIPPAFLMLQGLGVVLAARALCRHDPSLFLRVLRTIVAAGAAAAVLTLLYLLEVSIETGQSVGALIQSPSRWRFIVPSVNPAGSYFLLVTCVAIGLAAASPFRRSIGFVVIALLTALAGWLTKSRTAIVAFMTTATAVGAWLATRRLPVRNRRALFAGTLGLALAAGVLMVMLNPFGILAPGGEESLGVRQVLLRGGLAMVEDNPWFGVGIRQFRVRYPEYLPRDRTPYVEDDPHNHLLGITTELGLIGLAAFLWFLIAAMRQASRGVLASADTRVSMRALGVLAGLVAFLITSLSNQPLNIPVPALTFWILLGAVAGSATAGATAPRSIHLSTRRSISIATTLALVVLIATVPFRARAAINAIDMTLVQYGFHDWEIDSAGTTFHWSSGHSTLFLSSEMSLVNLPIGASRGGAPNGAEIRIDVDGEPTGRMFLTDEEWHPIRLVAPRNGRKFWRVDLYVSPTFVPMRVNPALQDARTLGVRVGEPVQREILR